MKKKFLLACLMGLALAVMGAFADHPDDRWGVGVVLGGGGGTFGGGLFNPGLSLKAPGVPVYWGINAIFGWGTGLGLSGDYYFFDRDLITGDSFNLDWFLGLGGFGHFYFGDTLRASFGIRVPVGLSWHINETAELFFDVTPGIGLGFNFNFPLYFVGGAELGLRFWL